LFIPGNAGSYKQVRPIAAEAANYFHETLQHRDDAIQGGARSLDFFSVDFNEDFTAFHGQTLLDQAEYLNEAIRYILSLYLDPRRSARGRDLPDPTSVIIVGHSMGGIVARTMLVMPNYQANSINTIVTMSAPHARPPVTFDGDIVKIYNTINDYWRRAYSQQWANNNPLWHVTLVSIAGGGLDTVVPSDYASLESIVPDTHGFTAFTSTIPTVWTSMDHQAIMWCDQFRKVLSRALYDVVDVHRAAQTKPRAERMRVFKKWFLTGMEDTAEKTLPFDDFTTLLITADSPNTVKAQGERLVLRKLGSTEQTKAHLLPVPPVGSPEGKRFTLLTDQVLEAQGDPGKVEVLFCSIFSPHQGLIGAQSLLTLDVSGDSPTSTRLACKVAAQDTVMLPASTRSTRHPFYLEGEPVIRPFSYLQYDIEDISEYQFVAVIEKPSPVRSGFVIAEFSDHSHSHRIRHISLRRLLTFGIKLRLPAHRPMVTEIRIPSMESSLLAYNLDVGHQVCGAQRELFAPLVRQYLAEPYESKYYVNARHASISLHGTAPYLPPPLQRKSPEGLSFQFWTDPTCDSSIQVELTVDVLGSMGKLYMRYRTVFAAFPLLIVALVLRKQFRIYDAQGTFIPFTEGLDMSLRQSIPLILASLTLLSMSPGGSQPGPSVTFWPWRNATDTVANFQQNDLLIGTQDPFFWFLIPLIGLVCVGVCTVVNYTALVLTYVLSTVYGFVSARSTWTRTEDRRRTPISVFVPSTPRRRVITTAVLLFLVSTLIPYHLAYLVACLVQLATTVKAHRVASDIRCDANTNLYNYAHSILILLLWVLPINLPILVVWLRNLTVHWLTPFSSHHNVLSIAPFIILVETLTAGKLVPQVSSQLRHVTSILLFGVAICAAVYGVSHAYILHFLVNLVVAWLVIVHSTQESWSFTGLSTVFSGAPPDRKQGKSP
jgi:GPI inositol-deacylase